MKNKHKTIKIGLGIFAIAFATALISINEPQKVIEQPINDSIQANHQFDSITPEQQAEFDSIIKSENL